MKIIKKYDLENFKNILTCIFYGLICGVLTGAFTFFFKFLTNKCEWVSRWIYQTAKNSYYYIILVFIALIALSLICYLLHKQFPESKGGGIPRSEGVLRGLLTFKWANALIGAFAGSIIGFLCGIPIGGEGPSVLMGTAIGAMCAGLTKHKSAWERYVMSGGAGAGFAVVTGAPLSGILFVIEEVHKRFSLLLVLTVSTSVIVAGITSSCLAKIFSVDLTFINFNSNCKFELSDLGYLSLLGVIMAFTVGFYDWSIACFEKLTKRLKKFLPKWLKLVAVFLITGILGFVLSDAIYSGHDVIIFLTKTKVAITTLILLVILRLVMMLFVTDSGVTGGIFIPTLTIGALFGAITSNLLLSLGMDQSLRPAVILLGACAFLGGSLRAPITASVFFLELTGCFTNIIYVIFVIFTVSTINEFFNQMPFYDKVLKNMEEHEHEGKTFKTGYFKVKVEKGAFVVGKTVREIMWPPYCAVLSILRKVDEQEEFFNAIDQQILENDVITLRANYYEKERLEKLLHDLVGMGNQIENYDKF
ncbi:MAG: chloride channel protein [Clostridia bacterium]|nr:chloride channel protein [Clostridia bacterium]